MTTACKSTISHVNYSQLETTITPYHSRSLNDNDIETLTMHIHAINMNQQQQSSLQETSSKEFPENTPDVTTQQVALKNLKIMQSIGLLTLSPVYLPLRMRIITDITHHSLHPIIFRNRLTRLQLYKLEQESFVIKIQKGSKDLVNTEHTVLFSVPPHDSLIEFLGVNTDNNTVLSYGENCDLSQKMCSANALHLSQQFFNKIVRQIAHGLNHLHRHNVIYRDLQPGNIVLTRNDDAKIIDFNCSLLLSKSERKKIDDKGHIYTVGAGALSCMPPECHIYTITDTALVAFQGDTWSFGCLIFYLIDVKHGHLIQYITQKSGLTSENDVLSWLDTIDRCFNTINPKELEQWIRDQIDTSYQEALSQGRDIPLYFPQLAKACLVISYTKRPTMEQIIEQFFPS